jgi:hypothetical protein
LIASSLYYLGRGGQLLGMWILLVDLFTAGPMGPNPRLFGAGVAVFLAGWGLTRLRRRP